MEEQKPENFLQKPIRTYESDIAEAIGHKQASQVSISIAENERQRNPDPAKNIVIQNIPEEQKSSSSVGKNILKILLSLILIGGGIVGGYYLYSISPIAKKPVITEQTASAIPAIIPPDIQKTIDITGDSAGQIINDIKSQPLNALSSGQIMELVFYEISSSSDAADNSSEKNIAVRTSGPDFISKISFSAPDVLARSLTDPSMIGIYKGTDMAGKPFIILTTNFFQNAFAGMLQWEPTMADDVTKIFGLNPDNATASTSASSSISQYFGIRGTFVDKIIENKNVREFIDTNGNFLFLYAFIDNNTIVITDGEDALSEIINRFEKKAYIR